MDHVVAKDFKTVNRVMRVGTVVHPDDHLEPHDFESMKERGFIKEVVVFVPYVAPLEAQSYEEGLGQPARDEAQSS